MKMQTEKKRLQLLRYLSLGVMSIVIVASAALFFLILTSPLPGLRREENETAQQLQSLQTKSAKIFLLRERLGEITTVLSKRPLFDELLERIRSELPPDVTVAGIDTNSESLTITISSQSLQSLHMFIERIMTLRDEKVFESVTLSKVSYDEEEPEYVVTISSTLSL